MKKATLLLAHGAAYRAFGAFILVSSLVACSSSSTPNNPPATGGSSGTTSVAGMSGGGSAGTGGAAGGNGGAGTGGSGGAQPTCAVSATDADQAMLLSATGCVNMNDPSQPDVGLVPYEINSPLWSDGAIKERFVLIPAGSKIHARDCNVDTTLCAAPGSGGDGEDEGHWDMPLGTVLVKNFSVGGKRIETRLLEHRKIGTTQDWIGFSYEWNDTETDATLLPGNNDGLDRDLGTQTWHYPGRDQCLQCHTSAGGRSLGPSTAQMNRDVAYAGGTMNQIDKFDSLGLFDVRPKDIAAYPTPADSTTGTLDERARAYLQTNCSICHRPGGPLSDIDVRYVTPFAGTNLCNVPIVRGTGDPLVPQTRLVPGDPANSTLSFRMHDTGVYRMPKIGSLVVDPTGTQVIDDWITSITACP